MARVQMIKAAASLLLLLPMCRSQFSIQGPSDGNRRAQGLKYSPDKGVEYTDQAASLGTGGFSIQGASDGNSDFQIQGATDGNSEFRIQGATDGNAEFQIHGPTAGGSQAYIQNYEQSQAQQVAPQARAIEYREPSGNQVNWRSYDHAAARAQATEEVARPAVPVQRRPSHKRAHPRPQQLQQPQTQQQQQAQAAQEPRYQQAPIANVNYNSIDKAPPSIQEILQFQAQIPYVNIIPEHLRVDQLETARAQAAKFAEEYPKQVLAQQPPQLIIEEAPRSPHRSRPRQPQHPQQQQQQQQQRRKRQAPSEASESYQAQRDDERYQEHQVHPRQAPGDETASAAGSADEAYSRLRQQQSQAQPRSGSMPEYIQQILRFQAQMPYDIVANQISSGPMKPYVPQPVQYDASEQQQRFQQPAGSATAAAADERPVYANSPGLGQYSAVALEQ